MSFSEAEKRFFLFSCKNIKSLLFVMMTDINSPKENFVCHRISPLTHYSITDRKSHQFVFKKKVACSHCRTMF